jgi:hypothetical protein
LRKRQVAVDDLFLKVAELQTKHRLTTSPQRSEPVLTANGVVNADSVLKKLPGADAAVVRMGAFERYQ